MTEQECTPKVKQGDTVWVPVSAGLVMPGGDVWYSDLRGAPIKGCFDNRHIPDHPALPAVARWLAEHPQPARLFEQLDWFGCPDEADRESMRALLAALTTEGV